jgi:hypothetical protein
VPKSKVITVEEHQYVAIITQPTTTPTQKAAKTDDMCGLAFSFFDSTIMEGHHPMIH